MEGLAVRDYLAGFAESSIKILQRDTFQIQCVTALVFFSPCFARTNIGIDYQCNKQPKVLKPFRKTQLLIEARGVRTLETINQTSINTSCREVICPWWSASGRLLRNVSF